MIIYDNAVRYWQIAKRFHTNRAYQGMKPVAVNDMLTLLPTVQGEATKARVRSFIATHTPRPTTPRPPLRTA